jgi:tRNA G10  N-methylase Trm11
MLERNLDPLSRNFDEIYHIWKKTYAHRGAVTVSFREVVGASSAINRFTHLLHPYPAKLLVSIPLFFLNCTELSRSEGILLDPFCGSGTVLLEGVLKGRTVYGCDTNPLARLITTAKISVQSSDALDDQLEMVLTTLPRSGDGAPGGPLDLGQWFAAGVVRQLDRLATSIRRLSPSPQKTFMEVCLSVALSKVSLADPTMPVPVLLNPTKSSLTTTQRAAQHRLISERIDANVIDVFERVARTNIARMRQLEKHLVFQPAAVVIQTDARRLSLDVPADLIITSPPYGSAQKYVRSSSLSLQWLGLAEHGLRSYERETIGREHYSLTEQRRELPIVASSSSSVLHKIGRRNPLRRYIAAMFLVEMHEALSRTVTVLRQGGHLIIVVGSNVVAGYAFDTRRYIAEICQNLGLELRLVVRDRIRSRGLITKRNSTSGLITQEWIMVFMKPFEMKHV